ncbi:MAG: aminoacyl-tRNA hydrolase [Deltaproteobacteria bacterium]|nr:aminoacyl-tRNA hydrolase [Deltaproteobacteria bacterium]
MAAPPAPDKVQRPRGAAVPQAAEASVRALVGLGNPGKGYAATRHNVGFMAIEQLAARRLATWSSKFNGQFARCRLPGPTGECDVALLQPMTYMNCSGHPTQQMLAFFGYKPAELLVLHDDLDLPFGRVQVKVGGGHGGHNGLRSLVAQLASPAFVRVRIGIGRPGGDGDLGGKGGDEAVTNWVLSAFGPDQRIALPQVLDRAVAAAEAVVQLGVRAAMNAHNAPPAAAGSKSADS